MHRQSSDSLPLVLTWALLGLEPGPQQVCSIHVHFDRSIT
jgi:hypothetical protein